VNTTTLVESEDKSHLDVTAATPTSLGHLAPATPETVVNPKSRGIITKLRHINIRDKKMTGKLLLAKKTTSSL
jgi:hypothetical protein